MRFAFCLTLAVGLCGVAAVAAAQEEVDADTIQMVTDLLAEPDLEMRAAGLQFIRDEVPGEAATKQFAALLPNLETEVQAELLEALGDRGDTAATPTVLEMLDNEHQRVRVAALTALGGLATDAQIPALADRLTAESSDEQDAARHSLVRLRGETINDAIVAALDAGTPPTKAELLGVLAARDAKTALPKVLACAADSETQVRVAAFGALRYLAAADQVADIVALIKQTTDDAERRTATLALLSVCSRGGESCAAPIAAGLDDAEPAAKAALLTALARAGGGEALAGVVACLASDDAAVCDQAARMLSGWPTADAKPHLLALAESENERQHVLALRGLVRLAAPAEEQPADLELLGKALKLAQRVDERRLALAVLGEANSPEALTLATTSLDDTALVDEAALAVARIAQKLEDKDQARAALDQAAKATGSAAVKQFIKQTTESL